MKIFFIITIVVMCLLVIGSLASRRNIPPLFRTAAQIPPELFSEWTSKCSLSTSTPERIVGMSYFTIPSEYRPKEYDALKDLGVRHVRLDFGWKYIAHEDGTFDWSGNDKLVAELSARGISVSDALVSNLPESFTTWDDAAVRTEAFMHAIVSRYKPDGEYARSHPGFQGIRYWEIFNEPNLPGLGFLPEQVVPQEFVDGYALLLSAANSGVRSADPEAFVISGGLSPDGMPPQEFLARVLSLSPNCFDIVALHPYGEPEHFSAIAERTRALMRAHGIAQRPVWFNEYGTPDDEDRARILSAAFAASGEVEGFFWFTLRDLSQIGENYGVLEYDYAPKLTYQVLQSEFAKVAQRTATTSSARSHEVP